MQIAAGVCLLAYLATLLRRHCALPAWQISLALAALAVVLYLANIRLIYHFVRTRTGLAASSEGASPGTKTSDLTAGTGIVPRWVSSLGLLAMSAILTAVLPWTMLALNASLANCVIFTSVVLLAAVWGWFSAFIVQHRAHIQKPIPSHLGITAALLLAIAGAFAAGGWQLGLGAVTVALVIGAVASTPWF